MGLFEKFGRKVGEFTHEANDSAGDPTHACEDCDEEFYADYDECPNCESPLVVAIE